MLTHTPMRNKFTNSSTVCTSFFLSLVLLIHSTLFSKITEVSSFLQWGCVVNCNILRCIHHNLHSMLSPTPWLIFFNLHTVKFTFYNIQFYTNWQMRRVMHMHPLPLCHEEWLRQARHSLMCSWPTIDPFLFLQFYLFNKRENSIVEKPVSQMANKSTSFTWPSKQY